MESDRIYTAICSSLTAVLPDVEHAAISPERTLADLGCNSIDRAEVVTLAMEDLGILVPVIEFENITDVRSLVDLFGRHVG